MIEKKGFGFIVGFKRPGGYIEPLFGPGETNERRWGNVEGNDLEFFSHYKTSVEVAKDYLSHFEESCYADICYVKIVAAETQEEFESFREKSNLVAIVFNSDMDQKLLYGPYVKDKPHSGVLPASPLINTNYETFQDSDTWSAFKRAEYSASELSRQSSGQRVTIGTFSLDRKIRLVKEM